MLCLKDYEEYAEKHMDHKTWAFYSQGTEREVSLRENLQSFTRYTLIPRMLRNTSKRDLETTILGHKISFPVGIAPSAYQKLAHPDGEIAASKAAEEVGTVYTLSTTATTSLEDIARTDNYKSTLFMQFYMFKNNTYNEYFIRQAEVNGYKALVFTIDAPVVGLQLKMPRLDFKLPPHLSIFVWEKGSYQAIVKTRTAEEVGTVYTLSTVSNSSLEDVANSIPNRSSPLWMQLYLCKNRLHSEEMIRKIAANGYKAIVLTIDTPVTGLQFKLWRTGGELVPPHLSIPNVANVMKNASKSGVIKSHIDFVKEVFKQDLNWDDVAWIKQISKLPLILKGVLTAEDAKKAIQYGVSGVWISNHGGRQLDGVPAAIDVLPEIAEALAGSGCEIYIDGGVRWGSDVLKALALGARAVFIGRPVLWGLAHSGQDGVRSILEILKSELDRAMHLSGCNSIADIGPHLVKRQHFAKI